jgi:hypothetical protein
MWTLHLASCTASFLPASILAVASNMADYICDKVPSSVSMKRHIDL